MSRLSPLRSRLNGLRRRRQVVRWGTAYSALVVAILWMLAVTFCIDWLLEMSRVQRVLAMLIGIGATVWAFFRYTKPFLGTSEDVEEMALFVERQQAIDSDLVAALQFESPDAWQWGSETLEEAVVERVGDFSRGLDVFEGFSYQQIGRRAVTCLLTVVVLVGAVAAFPDHASAFLSRLLMGATHYPTDTIIDSIAVNGRTVFPVEGTSADRVKAAYGRPLEFKIGVRGVVPEKGRIRLRGLKNDVRTEIELLPAGARNSGDGTKAKSSTFTANLPRMVDSVDFQIFIGDAWTDPVTVDVIPLPIVTVDLKVTPPAYALTEDALSGDVPPGVRQIAVIEGSQVDLTVRCGNKSLKSAVLTIGDEPFSLASTDSGRTWRPTGATPLTSVLESLRYAIEVEDTDGLKLERPIEGNIRIKADRGPRVSARVVSRRCLPSARPKIRYGASDDYGLSRIRLLVQVVRLSPEPFVPDEKPKEPAKTDDSASDPSKPDDSPIQQVEEKVIEIAAFDPKQKPRKALLEQYALDLAPFALVKGDELKVTVEAFDYRGASPPKSNVSEPLVLQITDREGVVAGLLETDENAARQLDAIIRRELGIGDSK